MNYETTQDLIDLTAIVSHDPEVEDWHDVHEIIESLANPASVLRDLLHYIHREFL